LRVKNQWFRRIYISDELDDLYGEYLFMLAELGIDFADDDPVFINVFRGEIDRAVPENFHVPFSPGISMKLSHPRG
jgi:hypothetical protein